MKLIICKSNCPNLLQKLGCLRCSRVWTSQPFGSFCTYIFFWRHPIPTSKDGCANGFERSPPGSGTRIATQSPGSGNAGATAFNSGCRCLARSTGLEGEDDSLWAWGSQKTFKTSKRHIHFSCAGAVLRPFDTLPLLQFPWSPGPLVPWSFCPLVIPLP